MRLFALVAFLIFPAIAAAQPAARMMPDGLRTMAPAGWSSYCASDPDACAPVSTDRWRPDAAMKRLNAVQTSVNARVSAASDLDNYAVPELWILPDRSGDCEDYALAKRKALLDAGWPPEDVRLAVATTEQGERHAVLTVDTDGGTYVLDNRHPFVEPWQALPYRWEKRQARDGSGWVEVSPPAQ